MVVRWRIREAWDERKEPKIAKVLGSRMAVN